MWYHIKREGNRFSYSPAKTPQTMAKSRIKKYIDIQEIERHYRIEEDGAVWSHMKGRYLKPVRNSVGYFHVFIAKPHLGWITVHRLVACKYIGQCPDGLETSHKDGLKENNHWTNLEYISHRDNVIRSYQGHGRVSYGPVGHCHSWETKRVMALKKNKPVCASDGRTWGSMQMCCDDLGVDRKAVYNAIRWDRPIKKVGVRLAFL